MTDSELIRLAFTFTLDVARACTANFAAPSTERKELDRVAEPLVVRLMMALDPVLPLDGVQVLDLVNGFAVTLVHMMDEAERLARSRQERYLSLLRQDLQRQ